MQYSEIENRLTNLIFKEKMYSPSLRHYDKDIVTLKTEARKQAKEIISHIIREYVMQPVEFDS